MAVALGQFDGVHVVATALNAQEALASATKLRPDILLTSVLLNPGMDGMELGLEIQRVSHETGVVLFDDFNCLEYFRAAIRPAERTAGWAYLLRRGTPDLATLVRAMEGAARGQVILDPLFSQSPHAVPGWRLLALTPRELQVLRLIADAHSNTAIAAQLFVSTKSIENHITRIYEKLQLRQDGSYHPRVQAARIYLDAYGA